MALLGKNKRGEEVYSTAEGGRCVMRNGQVLGELFAQPPYRPYSLMSDDHYRTVLESVEAIRRLHDSGIDGVGASAALTAMMPHWESHLAEGHEPAILVRDLKELKNRIDIILADLMATLDLPDDGN